MEDGRLRQALGYRRFAGAPRVVVLDTGYLVVRDVLDAARDLGWTVHALPFAAKGAGTSELLATLLTALVTHRPDYVLTVNHLGFDRAGALAGLLSRFEIPTASWFVDHPLPILGGTTGNATPHAAAFCFERTALPWLASQGFREPVHLPTASNARWYHGERVDRTRAAALAAPLAFAGSSWWHKARVEPSEPVRNAAKRLAKLLPVTRAGLGNGLAGEVARVPLALPSPDARWSALATALAEASLARRQRFAKVLAPLGLVVHGDPGWQRLAPVVVRPYLRYEDELPALFAGCDVNVNVTAEQMPTAVNQRVFDVPAVGGFLLTDAQEDAVRLFREDDEVVVWRDSAELLEKARYFGTHPAARAAVVARARAAVEGAHRYTHRLRTIQDEMQRRFA